MTRIRVLDLTDDLAANASRMLVGIGAEVIRVEEAPRAPRPADLHWYAGTRTVTVAPEEYDEVVTRLAAGADLVVESGQADDLRTLHLRETDPAVWASAVHVVVSPFGLDGPHRDWLADDHVISAAGGMGWLGGRPDEPPAPPPHGQATQLAGTHAAIGGLLGLLAARRDGSGQLVEISAQEAVAVTLETGAIAWIHAGTIPSRTGGIYGHVAHRVFPTKDGYVAGGYSGPDRMWTDLLAWLVETGHAQDLTDPVYADPVHRWAQRPHVDEVVTAWTRAHTTAEIAEGARARSLPWAEVADPGDLPDNPQLQDRQFFTTIDTPDGPVTDAGFPFESPGRPRPVRLSISESVADDASWREDRQELLPARWMRPGDGALAGLRVLDLTWVLAGPYVTRILGEHGADIVKVESRHRQDPTRYAPSMRLRPGAGPDESGYFLNFNRGKRSLALNLRHPEAPALLRQLAAESDVIVENFSPGTLGKWGLDPDSLHALNPHAVLLSMAGVGATGPWRRAVTFADTLAAWSGLTHGTAGADGVPQGLAFGLGDMVAANAGVLAILDRLLRGQGGHIDLSQLEAMVAHLGPAMLETDPDRPDTVGPLTLPARGNDRWLAVGRTPTHRLPEDPLTWLTELAAGHSADEAADILQARGIAAHAVRDGRDLVETDPQVQARGFFTPLTHPLAGDVLVEGPVHHLRRTPPRLEKPAPLLGQHTDELLTEILHLSPATLADLHAQGVLE